MRGFVKTSGIRLSLVRKPAAALLFIIFLLPGCGAPSARNEAAPAKAPAVAAPVSRDAFRAVQEEAVANGHSPYFHWGTNPDDYDGYDGHSNRLIPVYVFGAREGGAADLHAYDGEHSAYRDAEKLKALYGRVPDDTLNPKAGYLDQTDLYRLQKDALDAGYRRILLVIFDGMDFDATQLGVTARGALPETSGPGSELTFQAPGTPGFQFGYMVTSPWSDSALFDLDTQRARAGGAGGGYNAARGGATPWSGGDPAYLIGRHGGHAVTDSAASATSMTTGAKTYNGAINVGPDGRQLTTIADLAQRRGYSVGAVTTVPFDHATPAAAYANNVSRNDYQDLARDMLGLASVSHPERPLPGMDVVIGAGWGDHRQFDAQGADFQPGNRWVADTDVTRVDVKNGGRYRVVTRSPGVDGGEALEVAAQKARENGERLFGLFGTRYGHMPYSTANGGYDPAPDGDGDAESYSQADLAENPGLDEMTRAALTVLGDDDDGFWLMVEAGDVDWGEHGDNVDTTAGAILDGDRAVKTILEWVAANGGWRDTLLIVTADHGHMLVWDDPAALARRMRSPANGREK